MIAVWESDISATFLIFRLKCSTVSVFKIDSRTMTCSVEFGHGWTRLRVVVPPFPQGWLSERNIRTHMKIAKREECVTFLAGGYFHARTRISPTLLSVGKMRSMVGRRVRTRKR